MLQGVWELALSSNLRAPGDRFAFMLGRGDNGLKVGFQWLQWD